MTSPDPPITAHAVARMLSRSPAWFYAHRPDLEAKGFPKPIPVVGKYHRGAVQAWLDKTGGKLPDNANQNQPWKRAVV